MGHDEKKGEKESNGVLSKAEKAKKALKAISLVANMAIAKGQNDGQIRLWQPSFPLQTFSDPSSGPSFFFIILMVFAFGLLTGAVLAWFAIYPYISRITLAESGTNVVPRPSLPFHSVPPENRHRENKAVFCCQGEVVGQGFRLWLLALRVLLLALRALLLALRALPKVPSSSAAADHSRAGRSASAAAGSMSAAAGSSSAQAATEGGNSNSGARRRHQGTQTRE